MIEAWDILRTNWIIKKDMDIIIIILEKKVIEIMAGIQKNYLFFLQEQKSMGGRIKEGKQVRNEIKIKGGMHKTN